MTFVLVIESCTPEKNNWFILSCPCTTVLLSLSSLLAQPSQEPRLAGLVLQCQLSVIYIVSGEWRVGAAAALAETKFVLDGDHTNCTFPLLTVPRHPCLLASGSWIMYKFYSSSIVVLWIQQRTRTLHGDGSRSYIISDLDKVRNHQMNAADRV